MKKLYWPLAGLVFIVGSLAVWVILQRLPDWMGTTRNQHRFIDQLEQQGAIPFSAQTVEGATFELTQFKGKLVILSFWASWCGPCVEEFPSMISLLKQFPKDVVMVAVSSDYSKEDIDIFFKSVGIEKNLPNLLVLWDQEHEISKKYEVQKLPESFIFKKDLRLLRKVIGSIKWDDPDAIDFFKINSK